MTTPDQFFEVVSPLGRMPGKELSATTAVADLDGKKVALVWDYLFRGDEVFRLAKERFADAHPGITFVDYEVFGNIHDHEELFDDLPGLLRELEVDATVVATGA